MTLTFAALPYIHLTTMPFGVAVHYHCALPQEAPSHPRGAAFTQGEAVPPGARAGVASGGRHDTQTTSAVSPRPSCPSRGRDLRAASGATPRSGMQQGSDVPRRWYCEDFPYDVDLNRRIDAAYVACTAVTFQLPGQQYKYVIDFTAMSAEGMYLQTNLESGTQRAVYCVETFDAWGAATASAPTPEMSKTQGGGAEASPPVMRPFVEPAQASSSSSSSSSSSAAAAAAAAATAGAMDFQNVLEQLRASRLTASASSFDPYLYWVPDCKDCLRIGDRDLRFTTRACQAEVRAVLAHFESHWAKPPPQHFEVYRVQNPMGAQKFLVTRSFLWDNLLDKVGAGWPDGGEGGWLMLRNCVSFGCAVPDGGDAAVAWHIVARELGADPRVELSPLLQQQAHRRQRPRLWDLLFQVLARLGSGASDKQDAD
jgi:hypothetical protein